MPLAFSPLAAAVPDLHRLEELMRLNPGHEADLAGRAGLGAAAANGSGETLLHVAALLNLPICCAMALEANPGLARRPDHHGHTPLMAAASAGSVDALNVLAPLSDLEARSISGRRALALAASRQRAEAMEALLSLGADGSARSANGSTLLHDAARSLGARCVRLALEVADASALDSNGLDALAVLRWAQKTAPARVSAAEVAAMEAQIIARSLGGAGSGAPRGLPKRI